MKSSASSSFTSPPLGISSEVFPAMLPFRLLRQRAHAKKLPSAIGGKGAWTSRPLEAQQSDAKARAKRTIDRHARGAFLLRFAILSAVIFIR